MKKKSTPPVEYEQGHFTALIQAHDWPPAFVSRWPTKMARAFPQQDHRGNGGFDKHPVGLAGAIPYIVRGPVGDM